MNQEWNSEVTKRLEVLQVIIELLQEPTTNSTEKTVEEQQVRKNNCFKPT